MMKNISVNKLSFVKVSSSSDTTFLIDGRINLFKFRYWGIMVFWKRNERIIGIGKCHENLSIPFCISRFIYKYFISVACSETHTLAISST